MNANISKSFLLLLSLIGLIMFLNCCKNANPKTPDTDTEVAKYPSDVIPFMDQWTILLGDGTRSKELINFAKNDFFYTSNDGDTDWVVYKTPNVGITSRTSSNTRSELGQLQHWVPETGGNLTGTLKVMHVSTIGDARKGSSYSVVVGQIHSDEGHENEPLKIYYKKFPGHTKGSVFWNYEINTEGDNAKRWDYSTAVWGYNMSDVGIDSTSYLPEPANGIALGEEFSYEVNVHKGIMYLTFTSEGHETVKFTKSLIQSEFSTKADIPEQVLTFYKARGRDGTERLNAYAGELQFFKQGAYNQTTAQAPEKEVSANQETETVESKIKKQYANGCYAEVWFRDASVGPSVMPSQE